MRGVFPILAGQVGGPGSPAAGLIALAILGTIIVGIWKAFEKAGEPGWGVFIPIYNVLLLLRIAGRPWWLFLLIVPLLNIYIAILIALDIAENFGKGALFAIGLLFLGFIFWPILGLGSAEYRPTR